MGDDKPSYESYELWLDNRSNERIDECLWNSPEEIAFDLGNDDHNLSQHSDHPFGEKFADAVTTKQPNKRPIP
ncbi:hypothetical protein C4D60_Mb01t18180 [Musa balbisiana]|uniref:Uncharacterized protein n=1 Tax=Musa balbisiana TaxID=52838 RepID=A0A4S8JQ96_MUSBA|nr:hypothetical protein C4D60_Mb01t18180 [Musa balbisiana]